MVYVQDINGNPLMPTTRHGKVRRLLKNNKAVVVNLCPFTIRLTYETTNYKQEITLGVDTGTKHVGLSATTKSKELYSSEVILRSDIVDLLSTRRSKEEQEETDCVIVNLDFIIELEQTSLTGLPHQFNRGLILTSKSFPMCTKSFLFQS